MRKFYIFCYLLLVCSVLTAVPVWTDAEGIVNSISDLVYDGNVLWAANLNGNMQSVTISASGQIQHYNYLSLTNVQNLYYDNHIIVASTSLNWNLVDVSGAFPEILYQSPFDQDFLTAQIIYPYVIERVNGNRLNIYNISVPAQPQLVNNIVLPHVIRKLLCAENRIYASCYDSLFYAISIEPQTYNLTVDSLVVPSYARDMTVQNQLVYIATGSNHLIKIDVTNPAQMQYEYFDTNGHTPLLIEVRNNLLAVVCSGWSIDYYTLSPGILPLFTDSYMVWGANCLAMTDDFTITGSGVYLYCINHTNLTEPDVNWVMETDSTIDLVTQDNHLFAACGSGGIRIYDYVAPDVPVLLSSITNISASQIVVSDTLLYVADSVAGLRIYSIHDIMNPIQIGLYSGSAGLWRIALADTIVYGVRSSSGIKIINVSNAYAPYLISSYASLGVQNISIADTLAYVTSSGNGFSILDIGGPAVPLLVDTIEMQGFAGGFCMYGQTAYVNNGYGISLIDTTDPYNLLQVNFLDPQSIGFAMENAPVIHTNYMLLWNNFANRIYIYDVSSPFYPVFLSSYSWNRRIKEAMWDGEKLLSANEVLGFCQITFPEPTEADDPVIIPVKAFKVYPNPFGNECRFALDSGLKDIKAIRIYNIKGQLVKQINVSKSNGANVHIVWDGRDEQGKAVSSGIYFARLQARGYTKATKFLRITSAN